MEIRQKHHAGEVTAGKAAASNPEFLAAASKNPYGLFFRPAIISKQMF
jgi:hypothetical protein